MPDERLDLDALEAFLAEHLRAERDYDADPTTRTANRARVLAERMKQTAVNAFPALLALAREAERWKALATKAAPAMAFCAGRTDHHTTSVAAGIAWCNEFKDARNGIPQLAGEEEPSRE